MRDEIEVYQQHNRKWRWRLHNEEWERPYLSELRYDTREEAVRVAKVCNEKLWAGAYRLKIRRAAFGA